MEAVKFSLCHASTSYLSTILSFAPSLWLDEHLLWHPRALGSFLPINGALFNSSPCQDGSEQGRGKSIAVESIKSKGFPVLTSDRLYTTGYAISNSSGDCNAVQACKRGVGMYTSFFFFYCSFETYNSERIKLFCTHVVCSELLSWATSIHRVQHVVQSDFIRMFSALKRERWREMIRFEKDRQHKHLCTCFMRGGRDMISVSHSLPSISIR